MTEQQSREQIMLSAFKGEIEKIALSRPLARRAEEAAIQKMINAQVRSRQDPSALAEFVRRRDQADIFRTYQKSTKGNWTAREGEPHRGRHAFPYGVPKSRKG